MAPPPDRTFVPHPSFWDMVINGDNIMHTPTANNSNTRPQNTAMSGSRNGVQKEGDSRPPVVSSTWRYPYAHPSYTFNGDLQNILHRPKTSQPAVQGQEQPTFISNKNVAPTGPTTSQPVTFQPMTGRRDISSPEFRASMDYEYNLENSPPALLSPPYETHPLGTDPVKAAEREDFHSNPPVLRLRPQRPPRTPIHDEFHRHIPVGGLHDGSAEPSAEELQAELALQKRATRIRAALQPPKLHSILTNRRELQKGTQESSRSTEAATKEQSGPAFLRWENQANVDFRTRPVTSQPSGSDHPIPSSWRLLIDVNLDKAHARKETRSPDSMSLPLSEERGDISKERDGANADRKSFMNLAGMDDDKPQTVKSENGLWSQDECERRNAGLRLKKHTLELERSQNDVTRERDSIVNFNSASCLRPASESAEKLHVGLHHARESLSPFLEPVKIDKRGHSRAEQWGERNIGEWKRDCNGNLVFYRSERAVDEPLNDELKSVLQGRILEDLANPGHPSKQVFDPKEPFPPMQPPPTTMRSNRKEELRATDDDSWRKDSTTLESNTAPYDTFPRELKEPTKDSWSWDGRTWTRDHQSKFADENALAWKKWAAEQELKESKLNMEEAESILSYKKRTLKAVTPGLNEWMPALYEPDEQRKKTLSDPMRSEDLAQSMPAIIEPEEQPRKALSDPTPSRDLTELKPATASPEEQRIEALPHLLPSRAQLDRKIQEESADFDEVNFADEESGGEKGSEEDWIVV